MKKFINKTLELVMILSAIALLTLFVAVVNNPALVSSLGDLALGLTASLGTSQGLTILTYP